MTWTIDGRPLGSVLVSRQRYLGDIVMATAVLEALRTGDPDLKLGFLCESGHGEVLAGQAGLDVLHLFDRRRRGADARARGPVEAAPRPDARPGKAPRIRAAAGNWELVRHLRAERYDLVVDLFFNPFTAWLFWLTGIPRRIGGTPKWRRRLYTHTVVRDDDALQGRGLEAVAPGGLGEHLCRLAPLRHAESGLAFPEWLAREYAAGPIVPRLSPRALGQEASEALARLGIDADPGYLLLAPGATWPSKEWPAGNWNELVRLLPEVTNLPLAVLLPPTRSTRWHGLGETDTAAGGGVLPVLPLHAALDVVAGCSGLISVDGGMMHAAVGYGRPTLGLFGPTDPDIWFPYEGAGPYRVLARAPHCHPCDRHECDEFVCLPELEPRTVAEACGELLGTADGSGAP